MFEPKNLQRDEQGDAPPSFLARARLPSPPTRDVNISTGNSATRPPLRKRLLSWVELGASLDQEGYLRGHVCRFIWNCLSMDLPRITNYNNAD